MDKKRKRFKNEQEILAEIDLCHARAKAFREEAQKLDTEAQQQIRDAYDIERENIALSEFSPVPTPLKAVQAECVRWGIEPFVLTCHVEALGGTKKLTPLEDMEPDTLRWIAKSWPRILDYHIGYLRAQSSHKIKTAKRRLASADNLTNSKAVKLGQDLAVMRTEAMGFLPDTNRAHDTSIPATA